MPGTANTWFQASPNTDGQFIIGPEYFRDIAAVATLAYAGGVLTLNAAASTSPNLVASLDIFTRTGMQINFQENYGTSNGPGPNSATTNDPQGLQQIPPILKANLATLTGGPRGYYPKGIQLNSYTVFYKVTTVALTSFTTGLFANALVAGQAAPTQTVLVAQAQNGLSLAASANIQAVKISLVTPVMLTTANQIVELNLSPVVAGTGSLTIYGVVFQANYNLN